MKIVNSDYINNIIFIVLLLIVVLIVCFKSISIHNSIMENFAENDNSEMGKMEEEMDAAMGKNDNSSMMNNLDEMLDDLGGIYNQNDDENNEEI